MKETVLITGGLGFIGINLTQRLLRTTSYSVIVFNRGKKKMSYDLSAIFGSSKRLKIVYGDILHKQDIEEVIKKSSIIVHLAASTHISDITNILPLVQTNIIGTTILLESIVKFPVKKLILLSSSGVYGNKQKGILMDENHPLLPLNPYTASKLAAEKLAYSFYFSAKVPIIILRPFNIYGPYQEPSKTIPLFITRLLQKKSIVLNHGGRQKRDWVYVDDLTAVIERIIYAPNNKVVGEVFNISNGKPITIKDTAKTILRQLGKNKSHFKIPTVSLPEAMYNVGTSRKIKKLLNWSPKYPLESGIKETIKWYKSNKQWWNAII